MAKTGEAVYCLPALAGRSGAIFYIPEVPEIHSFVEDN